MTGPDPGSIERWFLLLYLSSILLVPTLSWICSLLLRCMERTWARRTLDCLMGECFRPICKVSPIMNPISFHQWVLMVLPCFLTQAFPQLLPHCLLSHFNLLHSNLCPHSNFLNVILQLFSRELLNCWWVWFLNLREFMVIFNLLKTKNFP